MYASTYFWSSGPPTLKYSFSFSLPPPVPGSNPPYYTPLAPHFWGSLCTWVSSLVLDSSFLAPHPCYLQGGYQRSSGNKHALCWPSSLSKCPLLAHNTAPHPKPHTHETTSKISLAPPLHQRHLWAQYTSLNSCKSWPMYPHLHPFFFRCLLTESLWSFFGRVALPGS